MKKPKPKAKKPARARAARPAPAPDAEDLARKDANELFPYEEPIWPGTTAKRPPPAPFADAIAKAQKLLTTALEKDERGTKAHAIFSGLRIGVRVLCRWLADMAANGNNDEARAAQYCLFEIAEQTTQDLNEGFRQGWGRAIQLAQRTPAVPGFISRNPANDAHAQKLLRDIQQGKDVPAVVKPHGKKSKVVLDSPAQLLVACLHDYMNNLRADFLSLPDMKQAAPPRVRQILDLQPYTAATWLDWHRVAWEIILYFSPKGDPTYHPAFAKEPLRGIRAPLVKTLADAWKMRAS